jgi:hypothetical protein
VLRFIPRVVYKVGGKENRESFSVWSQNILDQRAVWRLCLILPFPRHAVFSWLVLGWIPASAFSRQDLKLFPSAEPTNHSVGCSLHQWHSASYMGVWEVPKERLRFHQLPVGSSLQWGGERRARHSTESPVCPNLTMCVFVSAHCWYSHTPGLIPLPREASQKDASSVVRSAHHTSLICP